MHFCLRRATPGPFCAAWSHQMNAESKRSDSPPPPQRTLTKELRARRRQNWSEDLVPRPGRRIVQRFVIWITGSIGQEVESLTVRFTLTFSRRKQCRRNHLIIPFCFFFNRRGSALGEITRGVQALWCTSSQPMKALVWFLFFSCVFFFLCVFFADDRLRWLVVWPESRAKPQLLHSYTVAISSLSLWAQISY